MTDDNNKPPVTMLSAEELLAPGIEPVEVEIPGGGAVKVRAFTKREIDRMREECKLPNGKVDTDKLERAWFLAGLVEPKLTDEQYDKIADAPGGVYFTILQAIMDESGLSREAVNATRRSFRRRPRV